MIAGAALTVWDGIGQFALAVVLGVVVGLVFGIGLHQLRMRVADPVVIGTFGLLVPFGAYAIAEHLGGSGVLAVVAMGLYVGYNAPRTDYRTRQQEAPLWLSADLLLESFVFAYIGLQFRRVLDDLGDESVEHILWLSAAVLLTVLLVRPLYIYPAHAVARFWERQRLRRWERQVAKGRLDAKRHGRGRGELSPERMRERLTEPALDWKDNAVISWAGMRGVVTLATALAAADIAALPTGPSHVIVIVAFVVTVATLLLQGLTLPLLIRWLGVASDVDHESDARALASVRSRTKQAGTAYLAAQREEWEKKYGAVDLRFFDAFARRMTKVETDTDRAQEAEESLARPSAEDLVALSRGWLQVRREVLFEERDAGILNEEVMRELITAMDAEELALDTRRYPGRV